MSDILLPAYMIDLERREAREAELADRLYRARTVCDCPIMGIFEPGGGVQPEVELATVGPAGILMHCPHCGEEHRCFRVVVPKVGGE